MLLRDVAPGTRMVVMSPDGEVRGEFIAGDYVDHMLTVKVAEGSYLPPGTQAGDTVQIEEAHE